MQDTIIRIPIQRHSPLLGNVSSLMNSSKFRRGTGSSSGHPYQQHSRKRRSNASTAPNALALDRPSEVTPARCTLENQRHSKNRWSGAKSAPLRDMSTSSRRRFTLACATKHLTQRPTKRSSGRGSDWLCMKRLNYRVTLRILNLPARSSSRKNQTKVELEK